MKQLTVCLLSCVVLAGTAWLARSVWGQTATEAPKEKTFTVTQSQLDKYVADQVTKAVAADHATKAVSDDEVLNIKNWHRAVYNKAEYVVYTGPGQAMFHHWIEPKTKTPPAKSDSAAPTTPATPAK